MNITCLIEREFSFLSSALTFCNYFLFECLSIFFRAVQVHHELVYGLSKNLMKIKLSQNKHYVGKEHKTHRLSGLLLSDSVLVSTFDGDH